MDIIREATPTDLKNYPAGNEKRGKREGELPE